MDEITFRAYTKLVMTYENFDDRNIFCLDCGQVIPIKDMDKGVMYLPLVKRDPNAYPTFQCIECLLDGYNRFIKERYKR